MEIEFDLEQEEMQLTPPALRDAVKTGQIRFLMVREGLPPADSLKIVIIIDPIDTTG